MLLLLSELFFFSLSFYWFLIWVFVFSFFLIILSEFLVEVVLFSDLYGSDMPEKCEKVCMSHCVRRSIQGIWLDISWQNLQYGVVDFWGVNSVEIIYFRNFVCAINKILEEEQEGWEYYKFNIYALFILASNHRRCLEQEY